MRPLILRLLLSTRSKIILLLDKLYWTCLQDLKNNSTQWLFSIRPLWISKKMPIIHLKNLISFFKIHHSFQKHSLTFFFFIANTVTMISLLTFSLKTVNLLTKCQIKTISNSLMPSSYKKLHLNNLCENLTLLLTDTSIISDNWPNQFKMQDLLKIIKVLKSPLNNLMTV